MRLHYMLRYSWGFLRNLKKQGPLNHRSLAKNTLNSLKIRQPTPEKAEQTVKNVEIDHTNNEDMADRPKRSVVCE